jgi:dipeptidyl aminopeptidase/acylaminoacyl peptidase
MQFFHAVPGKRIEVFDSESDIILYDEKTNQISLPAELNTKENFETFPAWSPDGKYLYYCSAAGKDVNEYNQVKYSLMRIRYDVVSNSFGDTDTLFSAPGNDKSVSFPRISPDGNWLIMTISDYGNFSIWHKEADLYLINLTSGKVSRLSLNSDQTESYHSWSHNGNWIVFSSRRDDGQYTRPYIAFFGKQDGSSSKPFLLPQRDPDFYTTCLKAFNLPELVSGKVPLSPRNFQKLFQSKSIEPKS